MQQLGDGIFVVKGGSTHFYYLTGVDEADAWLLLAPKGVRVEIYRRWPGPNYIRGQMVREILFAPARTALQQRWEGAGAGSGDALKQTAGVERVYDVGLFEEMLTMALPYHSTFWACVAGAGGAGAAVPLRGTLPADLVLVENVRARFPGLVIKDATAVVTEMRRIKDVSELEAMQKAVDAWGASMQAAMKAARPGLYEYEIEAAAIGEFRRRGGNAASSCIVASGPNAAILHYQENKRQIQADDLILVDSANTTYQHYAADLTRTFPASGKFTPRQKELYEIVLRAADEAIKMMRPGVKIEDLHARAYQVIEQAGYGKYFVHGLSHYIGIDGHDVGDVWKPLEAGSVITVEPGIYMPEAGLGIRIEDEVLVTADGAKILSAGVPRTVEEIEQFMATK
jgi:Xaa-Pro aminopeptidase